jgi:hypothetical protein
VDLTRHFALKGICVSLPHRVDVVFRSRTLIVLTVALTALTACAPTKIDPSITVEPPITVPVTVPTGTPTELMPRMVDTAATLSDLIGSRGDKGQAMNKINALWLATRPQLADTNPEFVKVVDAQVALCQIAVDRNRPADADKCFTNLSALVKTFLA